MTPSSTDDAAWPRPLLVILTVGLAIRLALWVAFSGASPRIEDEQDYVRLAHSFYERGEYGYRPGVPTSLRPPLYPALVAGVYAVVGSENLHAVRLVQVVLSLVTCVLVYHLGRLTYSPRTGLWAAGMFAFYPSFLGYNNLILTEVLFMFWAVAGVLAVVWALRTGSFGGLAVAGVALALGALTRSILFPFAPFLTLFLLVAWRGSPARRVVAAFAFALPFAGVIAPWAARNMRVQQAFIPVDCMGGRNFMMGNYEHTPWYRSWDAISITGEREWIAVLRNRHPGDWSGKTQGQIDQLAMKEGVRFIRDNPGLTARRDLIKFFDFWGLERELVAGANAGFFGAIPAPVVAALGVVICGAYVFVLFAGVFGAALNPPDRRSHALFLLLIAFTCAVHTVVFAHSRYHLPVMPFVMVYAAAAVTGSGVWAARRRPGFWLAASFCVLVIAGWTWNALAGDLEKLRAIGLVS
jgi:4-amino-4-deoxy-L-arabinose transferase-like glycosyltransferase